MSQTFVYILPEFFGLSIEVYFIAFILTFPVFFFFKWLSKMVIKNRNKRKISTWAATIMLVPVIYEAVISLFIFVLVYQPNRDFNRSVWLTDKQHRFQMANSIIESKMLLNKDTNQLKQSLGNPTIRDDSAKKWSYNMGEGGGLPGFLLHTLIVKFDKNKIAVVQHEEIKD